MPRPTLILVSILLSASLIGCATPASTATPTPAPTPTPAIEVQSTLYEPGNAPAIKDIYVYKDFEVTDAAAMEKLIAARLPQEKAFYEQIKDRYPLAALQASAAFTAADKSMCVAFINLSRTSHLTAYGGLSYEPISYFGVPDTNKIAHYISTIALRQGDSSILLLHIYVGAETLGASWTMASDQIAMLDRPGSEDSVSIFYQILDEATFLQGNPGVSIVRDMIKANPKLQEIGSQFQLNEGRGVLPQAAENEPWPSSVDRR